ncbi:MAG: hypothetical protein L6R40_008077 [Gallowayella cf. fulva]|nr:MAG: hypothetical protein L6R40_008077 [Xanthomendoza cf. fulva]
MVCPSQTSSFPSRLLILSPVLKRNGESGFDSVATAKPHSLPIKRAVPAHASSTTEMPGTLSITPSTAVSDGDDGTDSPVITATACVKADDGFHHCEDITLEGGNAGRRSMDDLKKRWRETTKMRDGYLDRSGGCRKDIHLIQTSDHPPYCWQLTDPKTTKEQAKDLMKWCYVLAPCNVPNGGAPMKLGPPRSLRSRDAKHIDLNKVDLAVEQTETTTIAARATAHGPGCHAKGTDYFFNNPDVRANCTAELAKGSVLYLKLSPNTIWNETIMALCFKEAGCDGGGLEWTT